MSSTQGDGVIKVILLGNGSVGKTSILQRFVADGFERVYKQTIGLDFVEKRVEIRDIRTTLQVWDIGGQSINSKMLTKYIYGSQAIMLCHDVLDPSSFADLEDWHKRANKTFETALEGGPKPRKPRMYLLGNKYDLKTSGVEEMTRRHEKYVKDTGLDGMHYVSAKSGYNVLTAFTEVTADVLGLKLTALERAMTEKVLSASIVKEEDEDTLKMSEYARKIEEEDRAMMEARDRREKKKCVIS